MKAIPPTFAFGSNSCKYNNFVEHNRIISFPFISLWTAVFFRIEKCCTHWTWKLHKHVLTHLDRFRRTENERQVDRERDKTEKTKKTVDKRKAGKCTKIKRALALVVCNVWRWLYLVRLKAQVCVVCIKKQQPDITGIHRDHNSAFPTTVHRYFSSTLEWVK